MGEREKLEEDGFLFRTREDAVLAGQERLKVECLEERMRTAGRDQVLAIYRKAVEERIFRTPVGMVYMRRIQERLAEMGLERGEIDAIPVQTICTYNAGRPPSPARERVVVSARERKRRENRKRAIFASLVLNIVLALAVIAMFGIAMSSSEPNVLNYRTALENQYSQWEQELREREQQIRDKERELKILKEEEE